MSTTYHKKPKLYNIKNQYVLNSAMDIGISDDQSPTTPFLCLSPTLAMAELNSP